MASNCILTVAGSKGGVGKTTTSINLGACFAEAGYSTVVVEADLPMANVVDFVDIDIDIRDDETLHDVLAGETRVVDTIYEVSERLDVVPSGTDLDQYTDIVVDRLEPAIEHLWWHYDIIILDTPAGVSEAVTKPIQLADEVVLVSTPRVSSVRNTRNTKSIIERTDTDVCGLVLTKSGTGTSPGAGRIAEFLDLGLLGHVPEDDAVPHSQDHGQPVVEYASTSGPAIAYDKIASKLLDTLEVSPTESDQSEPPIDDIPAESGEEPVAVTATGTETAQSATDDHEAAAETTETTTHEDVADATPDEDKVEPSTDQDEPEVTPNDDEAAASIDDDEVKVTPEEDEVEATPDDSDTDADADEQSISSETDEQSDTGESEDRFDTEPESTDEKDDKRTDDDTEENPDESLFGRVRSAIGL